MKYLERMRQSWWKKLVRPACRLLFACVLAFAGRGADAAGDAWIWREPLPQGNQTRAVVYGDGVYVAAGHAGTILVSSDSVDWSVARAGVPGQVLRGLAWGAGRFVAVGENGVVLLSSDGQAWQDVAAGVDSNLWGVRFVNDRFIAVGAGGTLLTSADGSAWMPQATGVTADVLDVAWGAGRYVATLGANIQFAQFLVSTDGIAWTPLQAMQPIDFGATTAIVRTDDQFVAVGAWGMLSVGLVLTSADGLVWTRHDTPSGVPLNSLAWSNGRLVALGGADSPSTLSIAITSTDALEWTRITYMNDVLAQELSCANGLWFTFTPFGEIYGSPDGLDWGPVLGPVKASSLQAIAEGNGVLVAAGLGRGIVSSGDGVNWTTRMAPPGRSGAFFDVAFGDGRFVAVGNDPVDGPPFFRGAIYTSPDGIDWTPVDFAGATDGKPIYGIAWGEGTFVATGSGSFFGDSGPLVIVSHDGGATWQGQSPTTAEPMGRVAFGGGRFVALSQDSSGKAFVSDDGIAWSDWPLLEQPGPLVDIAHAGGHFVVAALVNESGSTRTRFLDSADGELWTPAALVDQRVYGLDGSATGFVAGAADGYVLSSVDGVQWTPAWTGAAEAVTGSAWLGANRLFAVTDTGGVLERAPATHTVTPIAGVHGMIDPATPQTVVEGEVAVFNVVAEAGYRIDTVSGCDGSLAGTVYTTAPVTADCTVNALFAVDDRIFADGFDGP